jgi:protease II
MSWSVESSSAWLSVTRNDNSTVTVTVAQNEYVNRSRSGEIIFRDDNGNVLATLSVTQAERYLTVSQNRIELPLEGGESRAVTINAVGEYSISSNGDWFTVNHNHENNTFTVVADANRDSADRTGTVVVALLGDPYGETKSVTIDVVQYAGDINFDLGDFDEDKEWN